MSRSTHSGPLRTTVRTGTVALALAAMLLTGPAAWAGDPAPADDAAPAGQRSEANDEAAAPKPAIKLSVSPRSGRPGTKVQIEADGGQCDTSKGIDGQFFDRRGQRSETGRPLVVEHASATGLYGASYTISGEDAVGLGYFVLTCTTADGEQLRASASFRVRPADTTGTTTPQPRDDEGHEAGGVPVPSRVDTGLGGTADDPEDGAGPNPLWFALSGAAVLIGLVAWLARTGRVAGPRR
jgi:hypothetical protein